MNFAQRLKETLQTGLDIGFKAGVQKGCDLWMAALAQEGFGAERMIRMYERVEAINNELGIAWMCEPESDYAQEQLDRILEPVCGDRFPPFHDRNPDVKQFNYKRRERK